MCNLHNNFRWTVYNHSNSTYILLLPATKSFILWLVELVNITVTQSSNGEICNMTLIQKKKKKPPLPTATDISIIIREILLLVLMVREKKYVYKSFFNWVYILYFFIYSFFVFFCSCFSFFFFTFHKQMDSSTILTVVYKY